MGRSSVHRARQIVEAGIVKGRTIRIFTKHVHK